MMRQTNLTFMETKLPHFYELDWSMDYGETVEKVYLGIRGKLGVYPCLSLTVRTGSKTWHHSNYREIKMSEFLKKVNYKNIATFDYGDSDNKLLFYPKRIKKDLAEHYGRKDLYPNKERNYER